MQSGLDPPLRFLTPLAIDWLKSFRFPQNLGRLHREHGKFFAWIITSARAKIVAGIAQNVNQLQAHAVAFRHSEHLVFASYSKFWQMAKTQPGPKFSRTAGNEIGVFVELGRRFQSDDLLWISETLEIEDLAAVNLFKHRPDFFAVEHFALIEPIQTWLQRFNQSALGFVFL